MKLKSCLKVSLAVFAIVILAAETPNAQTRTLKYNTPIGSNISGFYEYLPANYATNTSKSYPLIIFINGFGLSGNGSPGQLEWIVTSGWGSMSYRSYNGNLPNTFTVDGNSLEYILFTPQFFTEPYYNNNSENQDINDILNYCKSHYRIDEAKIYLAGQSGGGNYAMNFIASDPANAEQIAAVFAASPGSDHGIGRPVSSGSTPEKGQAIADARIPVWISVSEFDELFPTDLSREYLDAKDWVDDINNASPAPSVGAYLYLIPGQHDHNVALWTVCDPNFVNNGKSIYQWMLQYSKQSPVPVSGLEIHANSSNEFINVSWETHTEINNAGFKIERSQDGNMFNQIGYVKGNNSSSGGSYNFKDESPAIGSNYYRIVQVDMNGRTSISSVVRADFQSGQLVKVYPNPVRDKLNLNFGNLNKNVIIQIFDNTGSLVKEARAGNQQNMTIDVSKLSKGYYHGSIISEGKTNHFSFVKQ